ncbi:14123_t:CDS:1, partial [Cetraspora pellucida]
KNDFADLPEDLCTIVESLNTYELIVRNEYEDILQSNIQEISTNQVHKQQESIEQCLTDFDIAEDNQDLILFQT